MSPYIRREFQRLLEPETLCTQNQAPQQWETPVLIGLAYDKGEITNEERLLYRTYALYEHESLRLRFRSNVGWFDEMAQYELEDLNDPWVFCSMSPYVRIEFQRLLRININCKRRLLFPVLLGVLVLAVLLVFHFWKQKSLKSPA